MLSRRVGAVALALGASQSGCIVAGYSTNGGWFLWPGGFGLFVIIVLLFLFRRGR